MTRRGNCIVGVGSTKGLHDLPGWLKETLTQPGATGQLILRAGDYSFIVSGSGDPRLTFSHLTEIVVRKSRFISDRTLLVNADKSASDIPRQMASILRNPGCVIELEISAIAS